MQINNASSDAFGSVSLSRFAAAPNSAHLFRAQHEHLVRLMDSISTSAHALATGQIDERAARALEISISMITLKSLLATNQTLQSGMMHKILGSDPRHRMLAEQHERDGLVALGALDKLTLSYGSPSRILDGYSTFVDEALPVFTGIKDRFRIEERDLFSVFDRMVASSSSSSSALPIAADPDTRQAVREVKDADVQNTAAFFESHQEPGEQSQEAAAIA